METKICKDCKLEKSLDNFGIAKLQGDGHNVRCKICQHQRYLLGKEHKIKQLQIKYAHIRQDKDLYFQYLAKSKKSRKNKAAIIKKRDETLRRKFQNWGSGARRRGHLFEITWRDIEQMPFKCFYTGVDLVCEKSKFNTVSLDRIDSCKGYVSGNVVLCCAMINYMKLDSDVGKFIELCELVYKNKKNILTNLSK